MSDAIDGKEWWGRRRLRYNLGLVAAGVLAFICYALVVEYWVAPRYPNDTTTEVTLITTAFQGVGYLVMIGVANVCYSLGLVCERLLRPEDPMRFRTLTYGLGFWFSFVLPFSVPAYLLVNP